METVAIMKNPRSLKLAAAPMAARRLISSLSRPAKIIIRHHLREYPKINSVYRSLLNPTPKNPNLCSPDRLLGSRFPSAAAHPFSTDSGSDLEAAYRRLLGIDDAPVLYHPHQLPWRPPKMDEIKINFCGTIAEDHFDFRGVKTGTLIAVARNSAGDALGVTTGPKSYNAEGPRRGDLDLQLYALKAAANLAKELENTCTHIGPVLYETSHTTVPCCFHADCEGIPRDEFLRGIMPPDDELEEVGRSCPIYCGSRERLREILPDDFFDFDRWDSDKALSGGCCVNTYVVEP